MFMAAEKMSEMAASPPRESSVPDALSVRPGKLPFSKDAISNSNNKKDGCCGGGVFAPFIDCGYKLANVFDESDDDSDGDGEMNQVSEIARLPMDNPIWSEPGAVAVDGTSSGGGFVVDAHAEINLNMNMGTAEKNKQQHRTVSLEALLRLEQQNGGRKDKDECTSVPKKKRKVPVLPSRRHQEVGKSRKQDDSSEALSNPSDEMTFSSVRSSKKKSSRSRSKSTTAAALARTTRLAPKGANADLKINSRANDTEQLSKGDTVFAAWWNSKKRDQAYTMLRGSVKAAKFDETSQSYDVAFDNGKYLAGIEKSLVISEHRYLNENLKPMLKAGQRVVAGWWEDATDTSTPPVGWFPGVINACRQLKQGGLFGPDRFYDIHFDDGDSLDDIEDIFVFPESEYDLLEREARGASRWKGVENVLSEESNDRYAQTVGYWVVKGLANKRFPFLGDALRFYDDLTVSDKGAEVKKADLNLPEDWDIDSEGKYLPKRSAHRSLSNDSSIDGVSGETNESSGMLRPAPTKLIPSGAVCLRGSFVQEERSSKVISRIRGLWSTGLDKILADPENRLGGCGYFEYDLKQEHGSNKSSAAEDVSLPSGRYSGFFVVPTGGTKTTIKEQEIVINFVENNEGYYNVEGKGSNEFGKYKMSGTVTKEGVITFQRQYHVSVAMRLDAVTVPQGKTISTDMIPAAAEEEKVTRIPEDGTPNGGHESAIGGCDSPLAQADADERLLSTCSSTSIETERIMYKGSESDLDIETPGENTKWCAESTLSEECQTDEEKAMMKIKRNRGTPSPPLSERAKSSAASEQDCKTPSSKAYPTATKTELRFQAVEASDFPNGWRVRTVPRKNGKVSDRYFYSPKLNIRLRSKVAVVRFLDCLTKHQGDEEKAWSVLGKQKAKPLTKRTKRKRPSVDAVIRKPSAAAAANREMRSSTSSTDGSSRCPQRKMSSPALELSEEAQNSKINGISEVDTLSIIHTSPSNNRTKPAFHRGEKVYAVLRGNDFLSEESEEWFPGRIWDFKVKHETSYGPVKAYDIIFDDGEVAHDLDEIWVMKEEDYEVLSAKPEEFSWIGVQRLTDRSANDEYARTVGWYETYFGEERRIFTSISDAMKSYDKLISQRGRDNVLDKELNFPLELRK